MEISTTRDKKRRLFLDDTKMCTPNSKSGSYSPKRKLFFRNRDWSEMPDDVVRLITGKLLFSTHHCRFAAACRDWYRIARELPCLYQENTPFMLIPHNDEIETGKCSWYQVPDSKTFEFSVPELRGKYVHGCSKGWLAVANDDFELSLVNILTRVQIALPEPTFALDVLESTIEPPDDMHDPSIRDCWMKKFVLSGSPSSPGGCFVAAIMSFYYKPFFCRLGDESWTRVRLTNGEPDKYPDMCGFQEDVIFFGGKLYVACSRHIIVVDLDGPDVKARSMGPPRIKHGLPLETLRVYLVECLGNLLYVRKFGEIIISTSTCDGVIHNKTRGFEVSELDSKNATWSGINSLGEHSLFLGMNESWAVSAREIAWCRPNCIYYVDDVWGGEQFKGDNGVFSLEDGSIEMFSTSRRVSPCMWYQQSR